MKLTNKEMVKELKEMQAKHIEIDWGFKVEQTEEEIIIKWGYLDGAEWTINKETGLVKDEHGEMRNGNLENITDLKGTLRSIAYYMVTRY